MRAAMQPQDLALVRSYFSILDHPQLNHRVEVTSRILADESITLLRKFFAPRR